MFQASDWYSMTKNSINVANQRAKKLWKYYSSLEEVLRDLYPEYPWDPLQFVLSTHAQDGFWNDREHVIQLTIAAEQQLGIQQVIFPTNHSRCFRS